MPSIPSWFPIPANSHFSLSNVPFGIFSTTDNPRPRPGIPLGNHVLDLALFTTNHGFSRLPSIQSFEYVFQDTTLNSFAALGRPIHSLVRQYIQAVFLRDTPFPEVLQHNVDLQARVLLPLDDVQNHMPMFVGDYTDFFVGRNHAVNCGMIFRGKEQALAPNYNHLPIGYHGRASSVVVSGTPIQRPHGQILPAGCSKPIQAPSRRLDFELEFGAFMCKANPMGDPIAIDDAEDGIFGYVLLNDWTVRDVQPWEMVPLGPFNSKNFGTSISPWVVLPDALEPYASKGLDNDEETLPYLKQAKEKNMFDVELKVDLTPQDGQKSTVARVSSTNMLFSFPQMLAHHTLGGCPMRVGDLFGSGTISGSPDRPNEYGSLLERTQGGKFGFKLEAGAERCFLEDGDTVTMSGVAGTEGCYVGFGDVSGTILPALDLGF